VTPSSATVQVSRSITLAAVTLDALGNTITGRAITWTSSNPLVATVSGSGVVSGVASGSATIVATSEGQQGSAAITVTAAPPPPPPGIPQPAAGDRILLDTRQAMQQATTLQQAWGLFPGNDHTPARGSVNTQGWSFTTDMDGQGTHALRADWAVATGDQEIKVFSYLPSPKPKEMYIQFKTRMGKHPFDTNANGTENIFPLFPQSNSCKRLLVGRIDASAGIGGNANGRIDYVWTRNAPSAVRAQIDWFNWGVNGDATQWSPQSYIGRSFTTTLYMKATSSSTASDGIYRIWIDGMLVLDAQNLAIAPWAFDVFSFPTVCHAMPVPASEYFWDVLLWSPQ